MPTSYTSLIGLAKPQTGELAGTWGDVVNDYLTTYVDAAVAGSQIISGTQTAVTLTVTNGASLVQAAATSAGSAQYRIILCNGSPSGTLTITAPSDSRAYVVINATATNQSVVVKGSATTGVTIPALTRSLVAWNGSDYVLVASNRITDLTGTLTTGSGGTGLTAFTSGGAVYATSTSALTTGTLPVASGGTGATTLTGVVKASGTTAFTASNVSLSSEVTGTLPVGNGGTGATSLTLNNVLLGNNTSAPQTVAPGTSGNVLASNGTTWASTSLPSATGTRAEVFTTGTSQSWTIPSGVTAVKVTIIGGGGGGGGSTTSGPCCTPNGGAGGGAGGTAIQYFTGVSGTMTYTVGAGGARGTTSTGTTGGTSSVVYSGTTYSATGGAGGTVGVNPGGGLGGTGSAATINISGGTGSPGLYTVAGGIPAPLGGGAPLGFPGGSNGYGAGGSGQGLGGTPASTAGKGGIIIFEY